MKTLAAERKLSLLSLSAQNMSYYSPGSKVNHAHRGETADGMPVLSHVGPI